MRALLWRDYLCPWCYLGRDRTRVMESLGVSVLPLGYDLHPEVPQGGRAIRPDGRLDRVLDHVAAECETAGMPMRKPTRSPNTRRALEIAEILRVTAADSFAAYDDACYRAHWVDGGDLGDDTTLWTLVGDAGADVDRTRRASADGLGARELARSMTAARAQGVAATPAWWVDERLLIPGVQPRETVERWVTRLLERSPN
jgi:predicted DsbA family dithiol-disulfide isomerase